MSNTRLLASLLMLGLLTACGSSPNVQYYALSPVDQADTQARLAAAIGLARVQLPEYLNRNAIVRRLDDHRLHLSATHAWAEPLADAVPRVLAARLREALPQHPLLIAPWDRRQAPALRVSIRIDRLDAGTDDVVLSAGWQIHGRDGGAALDRQQVFRVSLADSNYGTLVAAHDVALAQLATAVAADLTNPSTAPLKP